MLNKLISLKTHGFKFLCKRGETPVWSPLCLRRTGINDVLELRVSFKKNPSLPYYNINILVPPINHTLSELIEMEEECLLWAQKQVLYQEVNFHVLKNTGVTGLCITAYPNLQPSAYPLLIHHIMALFSIDDKLDNQSDFSIYWHYCTFFHHPQRANYIDDDVFTDQDLPKPVVSTSNPLAVSTLEIFSYLTETYPAHQAKSLNKQIFKSLFDDYLQYVQKEKDHIDHSKQYAECDLDQLRPYTSGAVYAIKLGILIQGIDIDQSEETWKAYYEDKILSAAKCVMWGNDIVSALKEIEHAKPDAPITNNVIVHKRLHPDEDAYSHVICRYNTEVKQCLSSNSLMLKEPNSVKSDAIIKGWISQLVWAFCIPRYNKGLSDKYLHNLLAFLEWLN